MNALWDPEILSRFPQNIISNRQQETRFPQIKRKRKPTKNTCSVNYLQLAINIRISLITRIHDLKQFKRNIDFLRN